MAFASNSSDSERRLQLWLFLTRKSLRFPPGNLCIALYISIANDWMFWWWIVKVLQLMMTLNRKRFIFNQQISKWCNSIIVNYPQSSFMYFIYLIIDLPSTKHPYKCIIFKLWFYKCFKTNTCFLKTERT